MIRTGSALMGRRDMNETDKIFNAIRNCITEPKCRDCIWEECNEFHKTVEIPIGLGLAICRLLREQEPVKPSWRQGKAYCGACGIRLPMKRFKSKPYCSHCGRKVQWHGTED